MDYDAEFDKCCKLIDRYAYIMKEKSKLWRHHLRCVKIVWFCDGKKRRLANWAHDEIKRVANELKRLCSDESDCVYELEELNAYILREYEANGR